MATRTLNVLLTGDATAMRAQFASVVKGSTAAKVGLAGLVATGFAVTKQLYDLGAEAEEAFDSIRVGTGATGRKLEALKDDFNNVVSSVPTDFESASVAIADLNTRLGITGGPLRERAKQFLELSRITKTDVGENIRYVTRAFGDWEVATGKQGRMLDFFFRTSQATGAEVSDLADLVVQFGAPLRQVGFEIEEATAMFGAFEKAGVNIQTMMPGLKFALKTFYMEGRDPQKALLETFRGIETGVIDTTEALGIFGLRAGADMVEAITQGRFKVREFTNEIGRGSDTVMGAGRATWDAAENFQILANTLKVKVQPVALAVFGAIGSFTGELATLNFESPISGAVAFGLAFTGVAVAAVAARGAIAGTFALMAAHPVGAAALAVSVLAGAFLSLRNKSEGTIPVYKRLQNSLRGVRVSSDQLRDAQQHARNSSQRLKGAEERLAESRQKYGHNSREARDAERQVIRAKIRSAEASRDLRDAEKVHETVRKATYASARVDVARLAKQEARFSAIKEAQGRGLKTIFEAYERGEAPLDQLRYRMEEYEDATTVAGAKTKKLNDAIAEAGTTLGPKYADGLQQIANKTRRIYDAQTLLERTRGTSDKKVVDYIVNLQMGGIGNKQAGGNIDREIKRQARSLGGDDPFGIALAYSRSWKRSRTVTKEGLNDIERDLKSMQPAAAQLTGEMMIAMAQQLRSKGKLSKAEVEKIKDAVVGTVGRMARQGGKKGDDFASNLGGSFGVLNIATAEALEDMGINVGTFLEKLGAKNPLRSFTVQYGKQHGMGGKGGEYLDQVPEFKARGGAVRVPGRGVEDTVPLSVNGALSAVVAPGEDLVVFNRHQRPLVDQALAAVYGVGGLPGFFNAFNTPHFFAKGGLVEPRLVGPDPLRAGGQKGINLAFKAAQRYIQKQRPKTSTAGGGNGAAFVGPPPGMKQLGDNAWVDSHTRTVASYLASKFGSSISSDYRSPAHNASVGGVPNSSHTRGSEANPGAFDFVPPSTAMQAWAGQHIAGLTENMIHDVGSGLHNHIAFFAKGGILPRYAGGGVVQTMAQVLFNHGFDKEAVAGIIGNAYQESSWNPGAMEGSLHNGGLFGFTASPVSLQDLKNYAAKKGVPWTNAKLQTQFMLHHGEPTGLELRSKLNGADTIQETTEIFMNDWERPGIPALDNRLEGANRAYKMIGGMEAGDGGESAKARKRAERAQKVGGSIPVEVPGLSSSPLLPGAKSLPKNIKNLLRSPGLDYAGRYGISDQAIEQAEGTVGSHDDIFAIKFQMELLQRRKKGLQKKLKEANAGLREADTPQRRQALLERRSHLLEELGGVKSSLAGDRQRVKELRPTDADRADLQLARAELTTGKEDDIAALQRLEEIAKKELEQAEQSGDPREIAEATRNLKSAADALREATPTAEDYASRDLALAELTEGSEDDRAAMQRLLAIAEQELAEALATPDPRDDIESAHKVKQIRDSLQSIEQATTGNLAEEMKALREEMEKNRKLSESEAATSAAVARRALADMISGELGPRIAHRSHTAGGGTIGTL